MLQIKLPPKIVKKLICTRCNYIISAFAELSRRSSSGLCRPWVVRLHYGVT